MNHFARSVRKPSFIGRLGVGLLLATSLLSPRPASGASGGELDLGFAPDPAETPLSMEIKTFGSTVIANVLASAPHRYLEDGRLDLSWGLAAPVVTIPIRFYPFPFGGWALIDSTKGFYEFGDGTYKSLVGVNYSPAPSVVPQEDGSIRCFWNLRPSRFDPNGSRDEAYGRFSRLVEARFTDALSVNNVAPMMLGDSMGRLIVAGGFLGTGSDTRLGLLRFLPDGTLDPTWNPAPALGVEVVATNELSAVPESFAAGPADSVLVVMRYKSTNAFPNLWITTINAAGAVTASFPAERKFGNNYLSPVPVVQPDGKILVSGAFTNWHGTPAPGLVRLNTDGSVDPGFDVQFSSSSGYWRLTGMELDNAGRLVIAGNFESVNGVPRPGLARVFAFDPPQGRPVAWISASQPRIGTNEMLYLTAKVEGFPVPDLQWYRNGVLIPGATNRGLRILVSGPDDVGEFRLAAGNALGSTNLDFPTVRLAARSPRPGTLDPASGWPLTNFYSVHQLVPLADGRTMVGGGGSNGTLTNDVPMIARLSGDYGLDPTFGVGGLVWGNGYVNDVRALPDGRFLIAGAFTRLGGMAAPGVAEIDSNGAVLPLGFPALDVANVSVALALPSGGYVMAGAFTKVGGAPAQGLARLTAARELDDTFQPPPGDWRTISDMALDPLGRLLIGGATITLRRLLPDGSPDPGFLVDTNGLQFIAIEPGGTLLVGQPFRRMTADGQRTVTFEPPAPPLAIPNRGVGRFHLVDRHPGGGTVAAYTAGGLSDYRLARWTTDGVRDFLFDSVFKSLSIEVVALQPDGSLLVSTWNANTGVQIRRRLHRIPLDSDSWLINPRVVGGRMRVDLATQPGRHYEIWRTPSLGAGTSTLVAEIDGDGYLQEVSTDADAGTLFLRLAR